MRNYHPWYIPSPLWCLFSEAATRDYLRSLLSWDLCLTRMILPPAQDGGRGGRMLGEGEEPPHGPHPLQPALPHSEPGHCLENPWNKEGLKTTKSLKTRSNAATVIINLKRKHISVFYKLENNFTGKQKHYLLNQLFLQVEISNLQRMKWKRLTQDTKDKEDF